MAIELIANIAPKNDGFIGMLAGDQLIGNIITSHSIFCSGGIAASHANFAGAVVSGANITTLESSSAQIRTDHDLLYGTYQTTSAAYIAHAADITDPHGETITQSILSLGSGAITGDESRSDVAFMPNIVASTASTPLAASNYPIGTVFITHTS